ncbi:MAG TPA: PLP-dependent aminotransferase family protein [Solirubrobacteraceae bacterium]|jgi:DNA-binding transcriptional MocR family regulator|nr:PLP-dependent aminotransferase family protein [Solirubrobacteraceae bacterium]
MSYKLQMFDLQREGEVSITQQLVSLFAQLIDDGELAPGERLPATRALAADVAINHLTAVRVYRRLAELGYVTAAVGRGTFVRQRVPLPATPNTGAGRAADNDDWQLGMLAVRPMTYADEMLRDSLHAPLAGDVIALGSGYPDPELCPSAELATIAAEIARADPRAATDYLQVEGLPQLRERLAEIGREAGYATSTDEILVTSGARQALDLIARAVLGPGDVAVIESPTFAGALASLQATGARVLPLPVDADGADIDALERLLARHEVKLVALQEACQNPTGATLSPARRARLLELARTRGFFVLDDGVYSTMRFDGPPLRRMRADAPSHVIYVDSLSKTIGGGLRIGWIAASGPVLTRLVQLKIDSDIHTSALPQHLAARYLSGDRHELLLARALPVYKRRRDTLLAALERHLAHDATWTVPEGGHHIWLTMREPVDERALYIEAMRAGMAFLPGGAVMAEKSSRTSMRLSFGLVEPALHDEGIRRLAVALREVHRRGRGATTGALS